MDYQQMVAVVSYKKTTGQTFTPGEIVEIPIDALMFSVYQKPWATLEMYREVRCIYDPETNEELVYLVTQLLNEPHIPPIYVDVLHDGVALVDGVHRVTAAMIAGKTHVLAQLNTIHQAPLHKEMHHHG